MDFQNPYEMLKMDVFSLLVTLKAEIKMNKLHINLTYVKYMLEHIYLMPESKKYNKVGEILFTI